MKNIDLLNLAILFIEQYGEVTRAESATIMAAVEKYASIHLNYDAAVAYFKSNPLRVLGKELTLC